MSASPLPADLSACVTDVDAAGDLLAHLPETGGAAWLHRGGGLIGTGTAARLDPGTGAQRFARAAAALRDYLAPPTAGAAPRIAFAAFTFDPSSPGSSIVVPSAVVRRAPSSACARRSLGLRRRDPVEAASTSSASEQRWLAAVDAAVTELRGGGRLRKVVLARDEWVPADAPLDPRPLVRRLAARFPGCRTFFVDGLVGATPELLIRRSGRSVASLVLAGSAPRAANPDDDARIGAALRSSGKDLVEHELAVASVVDALAPRCDNLKVDAVPGLLRLDNVQHLATAVRGTLREPVSALELAGALHPTAAVCGTPTDLALERIRSLEGMDRGRYSGPVGWVDGRGDGEFGIALRCAELTATGARLFAGAGIVADSVATAELDEIRLKLQAISDALRDGADEELGRTAARS